MANRLSKLAQQLVYVFHAHKVYSVTISVARVHRESAWFFDAVAGNQSVAEARIMTKRLRRRS